MDGTGVQVRYGSQMEWGLWKHIRRGWDNLMWFFCGMGTKVRFRHDGWQGGEWRLV